MATSSSDGQRTADRKALLTAHFDRLAPSRERWVDRNRYFYDDEISFLRFLVPEGKRVLELGCGTGRLLAALRPSEGVGIDLSPAMIDEARRQHPGMTFRCGDIETAETLAGLGDPFDYIVLIDAVGYLTDVQGTLERLQSLCKPTTRLIVGYFSQLWRPVLSAGSRIGLRMPMATQSLSWLSADDITGLLELSGFDVVRREWRMLLPRRLGGVGPVANAIAGTLPGLRRMSLRDYVVARPRASDEPEDLSVTVLIPCRNEAGNIRNAVQRVPRIAEQQEILFVEGHSSDSTLEEIHRVIEEHPDLDIRVLVQSGKGKGDAVRLGFENARGDVLMILDADLTVAPEDLGKFYGVICDRRAEFVNGTRLVYPLGPGAMRRLNLVANHAFARLFSWLLNQRLTDTLCGTKVLRKEDYEAISRNRAYFGDFDPFGDFDLLFGASRLSLRIVEIPVRYHGREYGEPQISRFRDGAMLAKMVTVAWRKMKVIS
jgi:SAM-dependent methyltransferase